LSSLASFDYYDMPNGYPAPQGGLMGLALHPQLLTGKPFVYVALVYDVYPDTGPAPNNSNCAGSGSITNQSCFYKTKILRYTYNTVTHKLGSPTIVIDGLMGSNDHNSGRLKVSPVPESDGQYHLYYTIGDQGAGQFNNGFRTNNAQNKDVYEGKVLRLNTEDDGDLDDGAYSPWIPNDNPIVNSVSGKVNAVYSFGHRNAQGLVWAHIGTQYILYNSEHGDKSDDEVNIILPGENYGWPKVAGMCDDNYTTSDANPNNDKLANQTVVNEKSFCIANNVMEPMFDFFNVSGNSIPSSGSSNYTWPTIAPSSIDYYDKTYIPGWTNSLLVTSLKLGMYRLKLKADGSAVDSSSTAQITDTIPYLHEYRIRDLAIAPSGDTLFLAIDSSGSTSGPTGGFSGSTVATKTPGHILRMVYLPNPLETPEKIMMPKKDQINTTIIFPNPATDHLEVLCRDLLQQPFTVSLFDMSGRMLLSEKFGMNHFIVQLQNIPPGLFVFKMEDGKGNNIATQKILVLKH
jgi:aldose sugar dehydrogenase